MSASLRRSGKKMLDYFFKRLNAKCLMNIFFFCKIKKESHRRLRKEQVGLKLTQKNVNYKDWSFGKYLFVKFY